MDINISGPVSCYLTKLNNTSYVFFGDYHGKIKNVCEEPCKTIDRNRQYVNPSEKSNCYEISRLLSETFAVLDAMKETVDFYLEIPFIKNFTFSEREIYENINKLGSVYKLFYIFHDCFHKKKCKYTTIRFHYTDIRMPASTGTYYYASYLYLSKSDKINDLFKYRKSVEETLVYQILKTFLTSDNVIHDVKNLLGGKFDREFNIIIPQDIVVKRYGKVMHRARAQLEDLEYQGDKNLADNIIDYCLKREKENISFFFTTPNAHSRDIFLKYTIGGSLYDAYLLGRMFRKFKRSNSPHASSSKVVIFAGEAHIHNYVDFFEIYFKASFNKYGIWKDRNRAYYPGDFEHSKRCISISNADFNSYFFPLNKIVEKRVYREPMEKYLTGYIDADRSILLEVEDRELLKICIPPINQYSEKLCDESFWFNRLKKYYPDSMIYKVKGTWKNYFLTIIYYIDKLKREFNFDYKTGNPKEYYKILSENSRDSEKVRNATNIEALDLIDFLISGKNIDLSSAFLTASIKGNMSIIKYLEEKNFNDWNIGLAGAAENGEASLIRYFEKKGATNWNLGLLGAARGNHFTLIDYFIKKGASDFHAAVLGATESGNIDMLKYLSRFTNINWSEVAENAAEEGLLDVIKYVSDNPDIDWEEVYNMAEEAERQDIVQYIRTKHRNF